jgi:hypothetical protein
MPYQGCAEVEFSYSAAIRSAQFHVTLSSPMSFRGRRLTLYVKGGRYLDADNSLAYAYADSGPEGKRGRGAVLTFSGTEEWKEATLDTAKLSGWDDGFDDADVRAIGLYLTSTATDGEVPRLSGVVRLDSVVVE